MGKYVLVAQSQPQPGHEGGFASWYDDTHLPEICSIPGMVSARRFVATKSSPMQPPVPNLAIYEIETDDIDGVTKELMRRSMEGEMTQYQGMDGATARIWFYEQKAAYTSSGKGASA